MRYKPEVVPSICAAPQSVCQYLHSSTGLEQPHTPPKNLQTSELPGVGLLRIKAQLNTIGTLEIEILLHLLLHCYTYCYTVTTLLVTYL